MQSDAGVTYGYIGQLSSEGQWAGTKRCGLSALQDCSCSAFTFSSFAGWHSFSLQRDYFRDDYRDRNMGRSAHLTGDVTIAPGAKLIINPGATIEFPNGTHLDVRGSLCAGVASCGASSNAGPAMRINLRWSEPVNASATGECYGMSYGNQEIWIEDPSCSEGILMRSSIDLAETGLRYVTFDSAWGFHNISRQWASFDMGP